VKYEFIKRHASVFKISSLCRVLDVHPSGYYTWLKQPLSNRAKKDRRQTALIKQSWLESGTIYVYRKVYDDLQELGERAGKNRVYRLMREAGLRSERGYRKPRPNYGGEPAVTAPNVLDQQFNADRPNKIWVTDITMIRTYEGWLYLAVVIDLFSRQVIGWSMQSRVHADLVLRALLMAVWRRKRKRQSIPTRLNGAFHGMSRSMSSRSAVGSFSNNQLK
jgi:putative transposase